MIVLVVGLGGKVIIINRGNFFKGFIKDKCRWEIFLILI